MSNITTKKLIIDTDVHMAHTKAITNYSSQMSYRLLPVRRCHWEDMCSSVLWFLTKIDEFNIYVLYLSKQNENDYNHFYHAKPSDLENFNPTFVQPYHFIVNELLQKEYQLFAFPNLENNRILLLAK